MKRTHRGFQARLSPEGRVLEVSRSLDPGCDEVVRCRVVLEPDRKPSRLGRKAQARRAAGGPRVVGRPSVSVEEWAALKTQLIARARGVCEMPCCISAADDPHHVVPCSAGGADALENLVAICRAHHARADWPIANGRLVIEAAGLHLGFYGFRFWIIWPESTTCIGARVFCDTGSNDAVPDTASANFWRAFGAPAPAEPGLSEGETRLLALAMPPLDDDTAEDDLVVVG